MKFKFVNQLESNDCGPACLAMVATFYGNAISLREIKEIAGLTRMGISVKDLINLGNKLNLESHGVKLTLSQLSEIPLPAILFWKQDHFVVLYKISQDKEKKQYFIADPSYGKIKIEEELLIKEWIGNNEKGFCLLFQTNDKFEIVNKKKNNFFPYNKGSEIIKQVKTFVNDNKYKYVLALFLLILGLSANWAMPLLFKKLIDDGIIAKSFNIVIILLLAQFFGSS